MFLHRAGGLAGDQLVAGQWAPEKPIPKCKWMDVELNINEQNFHERLPLLQKHETRYR